MPTQATIAITPGSGQFLDAVSVVIGGNTVVRETMVIADPTSPTQLANVTPAGAIQVDGSAVTQPVSGTITANQGGAPWSVTFPSAQAITGTIAATESGLWNVNQAIGVAGFGKITDGTNTAAVKAASVAALATDPALVVTTSGSTTAGAPANTAVTSTSSAILAANTARREVMITNTDVVAVYIAFGQTPTATAYHIVLRPCTVAHDGSGGSFVSDIFKGAINAITASTSGHVSVVELT